MIGDNKRDSSKIDYFMCIGVNKTSRSCIEESPKSEYVFLKGIELLKAYKVMNLYESDCLKACSKNSNCIGISHLPSVDCHFISYDFSAKEEKKFRSYVKKDAVSKCLLGEWSEWSICASRRDIALAYDFSNDEYKESDAENLVQIRTRRVLLSPKSSSTSCRGEYTFEERLCKLYIRIQK